MNVWAGQVARDSQVKRWGHRSKPRLRYSAAHWRQGHACKATNEPEDPSESLRLPARIARGLLFAALPIGAGFAIEQKAQPEIPADYDAILAGVPEGETAESLAGQYLQEGQDLLARGEFEAAIDSYTRVLRTAPREYTLCMKALLGRHDAELELGRRDDGGADFRREWLWGRGSRWPGWYIIGGILLRNQIVGKGR